MQILAEICQNRTACKDDFFRKSYVAQIRKRRNRKSCVHSPGLRTKNFRIFLFSVIYGELNGEQQKFVSCKEIQIRTSTFHQRPYLAQKFEKVKIHQGCYRSKQHQDSKKTKETKRKQRENGEIKVGCLPQALFFNAFQLGIMILKDAHIRIRVEAQ